MCILNGEEILKQIFFWGEPKGEATTSNQTHTRSFIYSKYNFPSVNVEIVFIVFHALPTGAVVWSHCC